MTTVLEALDLAQQLRVERSQLKRAMKTRELPLPDAINHPAMQSMRLWDFLCCLPAPESWGGPTSPGGRQIRRATTLADRLHAAIGCSALVRVADLTPRQRSVLAYTYGGLSRAQ